ncbi:MAG: class I SAM-dependent methyltransferase [Chlamydiales bacterium]|nr:class I SAM-dependent methyltransferase [Chlamydiales bacterium]
MKNIFAHVPIDRVRSYWNTRPCNIRHSLKEVGTKEYFEEVQNRKFFVEPHLVSFADFDQVKGKRVLEICCGLGTTAIQFAKAGAAKVTAVDLSEKSLEIAKKRAEVYGFSDRMEFFHANAEELSKTVPIQEYDLIFSFGVIHHTTHPEKVIQELQRYLAPEGRLKIMVYYRYSWKALWILLKFGKFQFWKLKELVAKYSEAETGCPITYTYSRKDAHQLLFPHGFEPISMEVEHIFPYQIPDYVQYRYVKVWYFRYLPKALFSLFEKLCGWHLCITAKKR